MRTISAEVVAKRRLAQLDLPDEDAEVTLPKAEGYDPFFFLAIALTLCIFSQLLTLLISFCSNHPVSRRPLKKPRPSPATAPATPAVTTAGTRPTTSSAPPPPTDIEASMDIDGESLDLGGAGENPNSSQQEVVASQKADKSSTSHSAGN